MKTRLTLTLAAFLLSGGAALALTSQEVIDDLAAQGYTRVEVKTGPTQMKVEAIRGTEKLEVVFDSASGEVLKREVEAVEPGDDTAPGFSVRQRGQDFLDTGDDDDGDDTGDDDGDDDDGHHGGRGDDDNDGHGGGGDHDGRGGGDDD